MNIFGKLFSNNSFDGVSDEELEAHLAIDTYGDFRLTDAIRPSYFSPIVPREGFRYDVYSDDETGVDIPVIMAAVSREKLFDVFMDLLDPLGEEVDVVLETSHVQSNGHIDLYREYIDTPVLKSTLYDFEDLLMHDGYTGIAVLNPNTPEEVQFDEHKLLIIYANSLRKYRRVLELHNVFQDPHMQFITENKHTHCSHNSYHPQFKELQTRLGLDGNEY